MLGSLLRRKRRRHSGVRHWFGGRIREDHFNNGFCEPVFRQFKVVLQQLRNDVRNRRQKLLARVRFQRQAGNVGARPNKRPTLGTSHYGYSIAHFGQYQASQGNCINRCIGNPNLDCGQDQLGSILDIRWRPGQHLSRRLWGASALHCLFCSMPRSFDH